VEDHIKMVALHQVGTAHKASFAFGSILNV